MIKTIVILLLSLFTIFAVAIENNNEQALIDINIGVELTQFETSAKNIEHAIEQASLALKKMANHPNMNAQQQAKMVETFTQLNTLSTTLQTTIKDIPTAITQLTPPILSALDNLFSNIQLTIILVLISIVLILLFALIALYYWIIKPTGSMLQKTTSKLDNMAVALQKTARIVEKSTDQQLLILKSYPATLHDKDLPLSSK